MRLGYKSRKPRSRYRSLAKIRTYKHFGMCKVRNIYKDVSIARGDNGKGRGTIRLFRYTLKRNIGLLYRIMAGPAQSEIIRFQFIVDEKKTDIEINIGHRSTPAANSFRRPAFKNVRDEKSYLPSKDLT